MKMITRRDFTVLGAVGAASLVIGGLTGCGSLGSVPQSSNSNSGSDTTDSSTSLSTPSESTVNSNPSQVEGRFDISAAKYGDEVSIDILYTEAEKGVYADAYNFIEFGVTRELLEQYGAGRATFSYDPGEVIDLDELQAEGLIGELEKRYAEFHREWSINTRPRSSDGKLLENDTLDVLYFRRLSPDNPFVGGYDFNKYIPEVTVKDDGALYFGSLEIKPLDNNVTSAEDGKKMRDKFLEWELKKYGNNYK